MRVIICGGRDFTDRGLMCEALYHALNVRAASCEATIVHGGAPGADTLAASIDGEAWGCDFKHEVHTADWDRYGRAAGPRRNQEMVDAGADMLIAFPGGRGTADCVRRAEKAGIRVIRAMWHDDPPLGGQLSFLDEPVAGTVSGHYDEGL